VQGFFVSFFEKFFKKAIPKAKNFGYNVKRKGMLL